MNEARSWRDRLDTLLVMADNDILNPLAHPIREKARSELKRMAALADAGQLLFDVAPWIATGKFKQQITSREEVYSIISKTILEIPRRGG